MTNFFNRHYEVIAEVIYFIYIASVNDTKNKGEDYFLAILVDANLVLKPIKK